VVGDVGLHLASESADVGRVRLATVDVVHDLVAREESQGVGVVHEGLDHGEDVCEVRFVVSRARVRAVDVLTLVGRVDVEDDVDADGVEDGHALIVVQGRVEVVGTDGVNTDVLSKGCQCRAFHSEVVNTRTCINAASRRQRVALVRGSPTLKSAPCPPSW
jgi:hypothetical protein